MNTHHIIIFNSLMTLIMTLRNFLITSSFSIPFQPFQFPFDLNLEVETSPQSHIIFYSLPSSSFYPMRPFPVERLSTYTHQYTHIFSSSKTYITYIRICEHIHTYIHIKIYTNQYQHMRTYTHMYTFSQYIHINTHQYRHMWTYIIL